MGQRSWISVREKRNLSSAGAGKKASGEKRRGEGKDICSRPKGGPCSRRDAHCAQNIGQIEADEWGRRLCEARTASPS